MKISIKTKHSQQIFLPGFLILPKASGSSQQIALENNLVCHNSHSLYLIVASVVYMAKDFPSILLF